MKLDGMKCHYCGKSNTHAYQLEKASLYDDGFYKVMEKEFGENRLLSGSCENAIFRCKCNDCGKFFSTMVKLKVEVGDMISMKTTEELMQLKVNKQ